MQENIQEPDSYVMFAMNQPEDVRMIQSPVITADARCVRIAIYRKMAKKLCAEYVMIKFERRKDDLSEHNFITAVFSTSADVSVEFSI